MEPKKKIRNRLFALNDFGKSQTKEQQEMLLDKADDGWRDVSEVKYYLADKGLRSMVYSLSQELRHRGSSGSVGINYKTLKQRLEQHPMIDKVPACHSTIIIDTKDMVHRYDGKDYMYGSFQLTLNTGILSTNGGLITGKLGIGYQPNCYSYTGIEIRPLKNNSLLRCGYMPLFVYTPHLAESEICFADTSNLIHSLLSGGISTDDMYASIDIILEFLGGYNSSSGGYRRITNWPTVGHGIINERETRERPFTEDDDDGDQDNYDDNSPCSCDECKKMEQEEG